MQGANHTTEQKWLSGVANMLTRRVGRADLICLQEAGAVPQSALERIRQTFTDPDGDDTEVIVYDWGAVQNPLRPGAMRTIIHHHWDTGGNRVNTAIVSQRLLPHPINIALVWGAYGPTWRPALGVQFQGEWVFSFHAISPGGVDASPVLNAIAAFAGGIQWRVGADFNRDPLTLTGALLPANSIVVPPNNPTYPTIGFQGATARYDYFVTGGNVQRRGVTDHGVLMSDHWSVGCGF
jgi:cytolethal distending toxin subunit B